jgi:hypothetical protein
VRNTSRIPTSALFLENHEESISADNNGSEDKEYKDDGEEVDYEGGSNNDKDE